MPIERYGYIYDDKVFLLREHTDQNGDTLATEYATLSEGGLSWNPCDEESGFDEIEPLISDCEILDEDELEEVTVGSA